MTISQSRWGSNAEVGRNPSRPQRKEQRYSNVVVGGAGTAVGGLGVYAAGRELPKAADAAFLRAQARIGAAQNQLQIAQSRQAALKAQRKKFRHLDAEVKRLSDHVSWTSRRADRAQSRVATAVTQGKHLRRAGLAGVAAGAGVAGLAALVGERRRGTTGVKRSGKSLVEMRREAQSAPSTRIAQAKAEGDHYRAMGRA